MKRPALAAIVVLGLTALARAQSGSLSEVTFANYSPLAGNAELARRLLSPLKNAQLQKMLASGAKLRDQAIDLRQEKFALYVPPHTPAAGYGLIVFVAPWNVARLAVGWGPALDQYGMIFVTAARSGNDQSALARREPLALLAEINVAQRYHLDLARIYIAGFSGGSRIALRLALGYPDVFRGTILNAGSDIIGNDAIPLPPRDLFARFQDMTHLVYLTGDADSHNIAFDAASRHSLSDWCVYHVDQRTTMDGGHDPLDGTALSRALNILAEPLDADAPRLADCRAAIDSQLNAKLANVRALIAAGKNADAKQMLDDIDAQYSGLAAPQTVELMKSLESR
jgi:predicted esterase